MDSILLCYIGRFILKDNKIGEINKKTIRAKRCSQECDCDFVSSGDTVIDPQLLQFYKESFCQEPVEKGGFDGNLWKWEYPNYNKGYMVVADVARGDGGDYSACHVIDIEEASQVAEYKGKMDTKRLWKLSCSSRN